MYKKFKKGFTLVELIVVMAIIAILSTVAVVSYSAIVKKAEQSKVDSELAQIVNVLRVEATETITVRVEATETETSTEDVEESSEESSEELSEESSEELTLALSEEGELQFSGKQNIIHDGVKLNLLFDTMLKEFELKEYTDKLDLDFADQHLVYTDGSVNATFDVDIVVIKVNE